MRLRVITIYAVKTEAPGKYIFHISSSASLGSWHLQPKKDALRESRWLPTTIRFITKAMIVL